MTNFFERLRNEILVLDGSMGAFLQSKGLPEGRAPDLWNLENPEVIKSVHESYIEAGSDVILTNTFGSTRFRLQEFGASKKVSEINEAAVRIAREAAGRRVAVAGDIGPCGKTIAPYGEISFDEAISVFREQIIALVKAGVDLLVIETMYDLLEVKAAVIAANEVRGTIPLIAHMTYNTDETSAAVLESLDVDVIGVNCSTGPDHMLPVVQILGQSTEKFISVQPNAGIPELRDGRTIYPSSPDHFAGFVKKFVEAGANIIGGCCGTTPEHIKLVRGMVKGLKPVPRVFPKSLKITGRSRTLKIGFLNPFVVIGERINPTGRKKLAMEIEAGKTNLIVEEARKQADAGAHALDINVGLPLINEGEMMQKAVNAVQNAVPLPLVIDSSNPETIEKAVKVYPGKVLINSVTAEDERIKSIFPVVKRYGTAVIALTMEKEIPEKALERVKIAEKILKIAEEYGILKENILFDPLALTVSAMQEASKETLEAIRIISRELKMPTSIGLSNVSFGLPGRSYIHNTFLAAAVAHGL
ncbi:MAG: homocysteine S-methyltransferase family protein, partial [Fidelibacterota bacterium]